MNKIKKFLNSDAMAKVVVGLFIAGIIALIAYTFYLYINWTDSNLEYVLSHFKDHAVKVPFWISAIIALISNALGLIFNIVCYLVKL